MFILILIMSLMGNSVPAAKNDADSIAAMEKEFNSIETGTDETEVIDIDTNPAKTTPAETKTVNIKPADIKPADIKAKPADTKSANTTVKEPPSPVSTSAPKKATSLDREIMEVAEDHPEIKRYYIIDDKGNKLLVRKELDLNGDGKIDYVYYYDNKKPDDERVAKVAVSNNLDGRFDEIRYYNPDNNQLIRKELDLNFDGRPEIIKRYYNGQLVKKEVSTNLDGVMNYWEYYQDGKLVRVEADTTGNGKPDKIGKTETPEVYKFDINEIEKPKAIGKKNKKKLKAKNTGKTKLKRPKTKLKSLKKRIKKHTPAVQETTQEATPETTTP